MHHTPVLVHEVVSVFGPQAGQVYIDATLGDGGHASVLLEHIIPDGRLLGLDQDPKQIAIARAHLETYGKTATLAVSRFSEIGKAAQAHGFAQVDGILFDLGISSRQLSDPSYGLKFEDTALLDMRLRPEAPYTAAEVLNRSNEQEIADMLYHYGDRHNSRLLARKIVTFRRKKIFQVARDLKEALGLWSPSELAPIFQALRIWVNQEYEEIEQALPSALPLLKPGGILAIISFHSGEDRLVKRFMLQNHALLEVSKKIITPTWPEIRANSRSRSAKLRWARKK